MKDVSLGVTALALVAFVANACSSVPDSQLYPCEPDAIIPDPRCLEQTSNPIDAGTDADAETNSAIDDPGLDPTAWPATCDGRCAPEPSGMTAGGWEKVPVALYVGPNDAMPLACPQNAPTEKWRLYDELVAPPAACEACACEASTGGDCSQPPEKIEIRAGICGQSGVAFSPFDGPANWDGSCSSEGGLSASAMCGNVPCAQSVWAAPLAPPIGDSCTPTAATPSYTKQTTWKTRALACQSETPNTACGSKTKYCVQEPSPEWLTCVYQQGFHELSECPDEYNASVHRLFPSESVDDRGCTTCSCGAPLGSACIGNMRVYSDAACSNEFLNAPIGSMGEACSNIIPQGRAIGAKRVTDLAYLSGTCASSGGEPTGAATVNVASAVTFCCMKPLPPSKPIE